MVALVLSTCSSLVLFPKPPTFGHQNPKRLTFGTKLNTRTKGMMDLASSEERISVNSSKRLYLGLDFGTSGARYAVIDKEGVIKGEGKREYPLYMTERWYSGLVELMESNTSLAS